MNIQVTFDVKAVKKMQQDISQTLIPTVLMRSLNKTLKAVQSTAVKGIAQQTGVKQKTIREGLRMTKALRQRLTAMLSVLSKRRLTLLIIDPKAKQNARGVTYRSGGLRLQIDHAFIATMPNGHRGIYARKAGAARLPIRELQGPSIDHIFMQPELQKEMQSTIETRWSPILAHELRYALQRYGYLK